MSTGLRSGYGPLRVRARPSSFNRDRDRRADDGTVAATGGNHHRYDPGRVHDGTLTPPGFRYQGPPTPTEGARTRG